MILSIEGAKSTGGCIGTGNSQDIIKVGGYTLTERTVMGVCTTTSNSFLFPVLGSRYRSSPRSTLIIHLKRCVIMTLLRRFLLVVRIKLHEFGSFMSWWNVHGPGPIRLDAISDGSSSAVMRENRGEFLNASTSSDSRGRMGRDVFPTSLRDKSSNLVNGSVRANLLI